MGDLILRYFQPAKHEMSPPAPLLVWTLLPHSNSHVTHINFSLAFSDIFHKQEREPAFEDISSNKAPTFTIILKT